MDWQNIQTQVSERITDFIFNTYGVAGFKPKLTTPPNLSLGHFSLACFEIAKEVEKRLAQTNEEAGEKKSSETTIDQEDRHRDCFQGTLPTPKAKKLPIKIAEEIAAAMEPDNLIAKTESAGPYVNITIQPQVFFGICNEILFLGLKYGDADLGQGKKAMVEYISPNTNKPLHLGHLRNGALGGSVINLLRAIGYQVIPACLINDRGAHICKSMVAWRKYGKGETPASTGIKGDHFVGDYYVLYSQKEEIAPNLKEKVDAMLVEWEEGKKEIRDIWEMMNDWVYEGWKKTFDDFGFTFEVWMYESITYLLGKNIVKQGLENGVFLEDQIPNSHRQPIICYLPSDQFGLDEEGKPKIITVLRHDGTSVYLTQDLGTAVEKFDKHDLDLSIYVVADEQIEHFKVLFYLLKKLGYKWADQCLHLSYGMVTLPEGRMKSREGTVVDADDLLAEMMDLSKSEIIDRDKDDLLSAKEINHRARAISLGAIKYYLLSAKNHLSIAFDPKASISFDGKTGPYCQYSAARIFSILRSAKEQGIDYKDCDFALLGEIEEVVLVAKLAQLPNVILSAAQEYSPGILANYVFETAQIWNQYYNKHKILSDDPELSKARLSLAEATAVVLSKGLNLLGIEVLEQM